VPECPGDVGGRERPMYIGLGTLLIIIIILILVL
jgi:hypothetical protein